MRARRRPHAGFTHMEAMVVLAIFAIVLCFNVHGDALRDALDPRLRR